MGEREFSVDEVQGKVLLWRDGKLCRLFDTDTVKLANRFMNFYAMPGFHCGAEVGAEDRIFALKKDCAVPPQRNLQRSMTCYSMRPYTVKVRPGGHVLPGPPSNANLLTIDGPYSSNSALV